MSDEVLLRADPVPDSRSSRADAAHQKTVVMARGDHSDLPPAEEMPPAVTPPPATLDHFDVQETIGRGGFAVVVKAFDRKLRRTVAIKLMSAELAATSPARKRFVREAHAAAAVRHDNVVQVHAVEERPVPYLVMEYVPGGSLQQYLDRHGPLGTADVLRIGAQVARGLAAAHATGLVHRDIKPANVLLEGGEHPHVKLTDFGLARAADDASVSQSGMAVGTPMYMAPEQARGEPCDHRADLYSLGSLLYVMVSGRPPFRATNSLAVLKRVSDDTPRPIREIIPETPQWLCDVIGKLHARDPHDRFGSAAEVADLLGRCLADLERGVRVRLPAGARPRSRRRKWAGVAAALAACAAVAGAIALRPPTPSSQAAPVLDPIPESAPAAGAVRLFEEVVAELREQNPTHKGRVFPIVREGTIVELEIEDAGQISDITALHRLTDLRVLRVQHSRITDLSPIRGLPLRELDLLGCWVVRDLVPLRGMKLEYLDVWGYRGGDLSPLAGMPLRYLNCGGGDRKLDLAPLKGMPLEFLCLNRSEVDDLSPLAGAPLEVLMAEHTAVRSLSPLRGMRLKHLHVMHTRVTDITPVRDMPLELLELDFDADRDAAIVRSIPTLTAINKKPAAEFWKELGEHRP